MTTGSDNKKTNNKKSYTKKANSKKSYTKRSGSNRKKSKKTSKRTLLALIIAAAAIIAVIGMIVYFSSASGYKTVRFSDDIDDFEVTEALLTPNEYSRPQTPVENINGIVVHYTANPGSTAMQNRDYFEGLKDGAAGVYASSHFIIGLDGEIIQCVPLDEVAYASNERNADTISIECCHQDESGEFTQETYDSLLKLVSYLCIEYNISPDSIIRHYDVTGKSCPKYFVDHEDKWLEFLSDIRLHISSSDS